MNTTTRVAILILGLAFSSGICGMDSGEKVSLPKPALDGDVSIEAAIRQRRSLRTFAKRPLSLAEAAQLLWAAQGVTARDGGRAAPSAGALYPLELYLVAGNVESLPAGLYRYRPEGHGLEKIADGDRRKALAAAALDQAWVRRAPAVLVIAGIYDRSAGKYGQRARRYTHIEVGHVAQNVYLQAVGRGLGTVIVGAFDDQAVQEALGLPPDHAPLALMPVGHRR
jgi:SagB-type dehydrogenase family enzyme